MKALARSYMWWPGERLLYLPSCSENASSRTAAPLEMARKGVAENSH